jgi:hypothetical protein
VPFVLSFTLVLSVYVRRWPFFFIHLLQVGFVFYSILFKSCFVAVTDRSFLGAFAKLQKPDYCLRHVYRFVSMEQLGSHWMDFYENLSAHF